MNARKVKKVLVFIMFIVILMMMGLSMVGCSIDQHLRKSKKQYDKALAKGYIPKIDTTYIADTTFVPKIRVDTTFVDQVGDTIVIERDKLTIRYLHTNDSIYLEGVCEADTIYKEVPITIQERIYISETLLQHLGINKWWHKVLLAVFSILIVLLIVMRLIR